jgi:O-antigen ligase
VSGAIHTFSSGRLAPRVTLSALAGAAMLVFLATGMALALYRFPQSWGVVLASGLGLTGVLALAIARYEAAVAFGFLLFGVVQIEPAPPDAVFAIVIAVAVVTGRFDLERVPLSVAALLGGFILLNLLSMMEVVDSGVAARFFGITLYLAVFSVWFTSYLRTPARTRTVVKLYAGTAALFAVLSTAALYIRFPGSELLVTPDFTRAKGLFKDPNVFGPFLVPPLLILIEELLRPRLLDWSRGTKLVAVLMLGAGVLASYSRGAWLNLLVGLAGMLLVITLRRGGLRSGVAVLLVVAGLVLTGYVILTVTGSTGFLEERAQRQTYDVQRFSAQEAGIEFGERHPVGIGPGQFDVLAPVSTHSTFIRTFAEQGVLGLMFWIGLALTTLVLAARNLVAGRSTYGVGSAALFGAWLGLVANSFFVDTLHWRHLWVVAVMIWVATLRPAPRSA